MIKINFASCVSLHFIVMWIFFSFFRHFFPHSNASRCAMVESSDWYCARTIYCSTKTYFQSARWDFTAHISAAIFQSSREIRQEEQAKLWSETSVHFFQGERAHFQIIRHSIECVRSSRAVKPRKKFFFVQRATTNWDEEFFEAMRNLFDAEASGTDPSAAQFAQ